MKESAWLMTGLALFAWFVVLGMWLAEPFDDLAATTHVCERFIIRDTGISYIIEVPYGD